MLLFGDNGILKRANQASQEQEIGVDRDVVETSVLACFDDKGNYNITKDILQGNLPEGYEVKELEDNDTYLMVISPNGHHFLVNKLTREVKYITPEDAGKYTYKVGEELPGEGTEENPYSIYYVEDLLTLAQNLGTGKEYQAGYVKLENDLDINNINSYFTNDVSEMNQIRSELKTIGQEFTSGDLGLVEQAISITATSGTKEQKEQQIKTLFGGFSSYFIGTFDGNHKTISNFSSTLPLFTFVAYDTIIKDLTIENVNINAVANNNYSAGGIAAYAFGSTISNCKVVGISEIKADLYAGGIIGGVVAATITDCYNEANVISDFEAGGIIGGAFTTTIARCYNIGNIQSNGAGGISAAIRSSKIIDCYNTGAIIGSSYVGGILGSALEDEEILNVYNIGAVSGSSSQVGGIVGGANSTSTISNAYYLNGTAATGFGNGDSEVHIIQQKTQSEMQLTTFKDLLNDGRNVWKIQSGKNNGYPILNWQ